MEAVFSDSWYSSTRLHSFIAQKITIQIFSALENLNCNKRWAPYKTLNIIKEK
jgi:hypothetical protein